MPFVPAILMRVPAIGLVFGAMWVIATGFRDWTVGEWVELITAVAGFVTLTLAPFVWTLLAKIKELKQMSINAAVNASAAAHASNEISGKLDASAERATRRDVKLDEIHDAVATVVPTVQATAKTVNSIADKMPTDGNGK